MRGPNGNDGQANILNQDILRNGSSPVVEISQATLDPRCTRTTVGQFGQFTLCDGLPGPAGDSGISGPTGVRGKASLVVQDSASCLVIGSSVKLCNGSTQAGATGAKGPTGDAGVTGQRGSTGKPPARRIALVGTGLDYPPTRAGIQSAADTLAGTGGGTVYIAETRIVSDGTTLQLRSGVTYDFMGGEFALPPTAQECLLISAPFTLGAFFPFSATVNESSMTMTTPPWTGNTLQPGDHLSSWPTNQEPIVIQSVDNVNGIIRFRSPLTQTHLAGTWIQIYVGIVKDAGLRNVVLNGNNNQGTTSQLLIAGASQRLVVEHITVTGNMNAWNTPFGCVGVCFFSAADSVFRHIRSRNINGSLAAGGVRDVYFSAQQASLLVDLQSVASLGFGPALGVSPFTIVNGVRSEFQQARGFRLDGTTNSPVSNLITNNHKTNRGVGVYAGAFGTHTNVVRNVISLGNSEIGIGLQGTAPQSTSENLNQLYGFITNGNGNGGVQLNSGADLTKPMASGNFFMGLAHDGISTNQGAGDPLTNGFYVEAGPIAAEYCHINLPAITDFPTGGTSPWLIVSFDGTNGNIVFSVRGTDGIVRRASLTIV